MTTFAVETTIEAPVEKVWKTLADIGAISVWNPGVQASHTTTAQAEGVGAGRYCDLGGSNFLDERVVRWEPNEAITFRIMATNMPFKTADIRFTLEPNGEETTIVCSPVYQLKFGLLGNLLDKFYVKQNYEKGMGALLSGLKEYVEEQEKND